MSLSTTTPILLRADDTGTERATTWGEFAADNADCLSNAELLLIQHVIVAGGTYFGGGGAEGLWTVRLAPALTEAA